MFYGELGSQLAGDAILQQGTDKVAQDFLNNQMMNQITMDAGSQAVGDLSKDAIFNAGLNVPGVGESSSS